MQDICYATPGKGLWPLGLRTTVLNKWAPGSEKRMTKGRSTVRSTEKNTGSWAGSGDMQVCTGDTKGVQRGQLHHRGCTAPGQFLCTQESFSRILHKDELTDGKMGVGAQCCVLDTFGVKCWKKIGIFKIKQCFFFHSNYVSVWFKTCKLGPAGESHSAWDANSEYQYYLGDLIRFQYFSLSSSSGILFNTKWNVLETV